MAVATQTYVVLVTTLLVLAIPVGLVLVIVGLVQYFRPAPEPPSAKELLDRRYAAGEISRSEYKEMRRTLEGEER